MKTRVKGIVERGCTREEIAEFALEPSPEMLNWIQIGGIGWQKKKHAAMAFS